MITTLKGKIYEICGKKMTKSNKNRLGVIYMPWLKRWAK